MTARYGQRVRNDLPVVRHQACGYRCARELHISTGMPAASRDAASRNEIAQAQLQLVRCNQRRNDVGAGAFCFFSNCKRRRKIATGMCRVMAEIVIIVIEVADQRTVDKRGERTGTSAARSYYGGFGVAAELVRKITRDRGRGAACCTQRTCKRIEQHALRRMNDSRRQRLIANARDELGEFIPNEHGELVT